MRVGLVGIVMALFGPRTVCLCASMLAVAVLTPPAALGTQSRDALRGIGAITAFFWLKSRSKVLTGIMIALFVAIALSLMLETWHARMSTIQTYDQDQSALGRINAWGMAFKFALHRLAGGGLESLREVALGLYAPDPTNFREPWQMKAAPQNCL